MRKEDDDEETFDRYQERRSEERLRIIGLGLVEDRGKEKWNRDTFEFIGEGMARYRKGFNAPRRVDPPASYSDLPTEIQEMIIGKIEDPVQRYMTRGISKLHSEIIPGMTEVVGSALKSTRLLDRSNILFWLTIENKGIEEVLKRVFKAFDVPIDVEIHLGIVICYHGSMESGYFEISANTDSIWVVYSGPFYIDNLGLWSYYPFIRETCEQIAHQIPLEDGFRSRDTDLKYLAATNPRGRKYLK